MYVELRVICCIPFHFKLPFNVLIGWVPQLPKSPLLLFLFTISSSYNWVVILGSYVIQRLFLFLSHLLT